MNWQNSWRLTYWRKIRNCTLIFWAYILLSLSALGNGEKNKDDIFGHMLCISCLLIVGFFGSTEALDFAQTQLTPFGKMDKDKFIGKLEVYTHMIPVFFIFFYIYFEKGSTLVWNSSFPLLQDFLALLAYDEPEKSPMFHLLSLEYRQHVADNLNRVILGLFPEFFLAPSCL